MESFFFVPGTRLHKIENIQKLSVSKIIIDIEDAVKFSEREAIIIQLNANSLHKNYYIRIPLYNEDEILDLSILDELYNNGFRKFIFPKIQKASDFNKIYTVSRYPDLKIILLVETPRLFLEVRELLLQYRDVFTGIGLGSHDFMAEVGGIHTLENLEFVRLQILYLARMINVQAVDIASMELKSESILKEEIMDGFKKGYDAKFFIHPWQVTVFKSISLYSDQELEWANQVKEALAKAGNKEEFNPIILEGQIIERPHLSKAEKIIKYYETK